MVVLDSPKAFVSSVDLTDASPTVKVEAAAKGAPDAQDDAVVVVVDERQLPQQQRPHPQHQDAVDATARGVADAGTAAAIAAALNESNGSDSDTLGLEDAEAGEDEWQPDVLIDSSQAQRPNKRVQRPRRRGACRQEQAAVGDEELVGGGAGSGAAARGWLVTTPAPCEQHLAAEAARRRAVLLVYSDAEVMVELISEQDLPTVFSAAGAVERKSKRARKNRQPVRVASSDSLHQLKLKVFEVLYVHPKNQRLFTANGLLDGDDKTLAQLELLPDEEVRVVDMKVVPNDDYASVFDGANAGKRRCEVELGFRDTVLGSAAAALNATSADCAAARAVSASVEAIDDFQSLPASQMGQSGTGTDGQVQTGGDSCGL
eukprot:gene4098-4345_t